MPDVVCVYKWNENRAKKFESWLKGDKDRYAIFLEDDPALLLSLPQTRQLKIISTAKEALHQMAWEHIFLPFTYEGDHPVLTEAARIQATVNYLASDFVDQGVALYQNLKENLLSLQFNASSVFGRYSQVPAVICGAGPSLAKNGKDLGKFQDKAVIFAGGAALEALRSFKVTPHFGAHVDADPKHKFSLSEAPIFYQLRTSHKSLKKTNGQKLLAPGSGNFPLEAWAQEQLGLEAHPFDGGWTVATFCTALALRMGCNPIIYAGMDLSTTKTQHYAPGVKAECPRETLVSVKNQKGEQLYSRYDWMLAAEWIEKTAQANPQVRFINATEGGLGFKGIEEKKLSEIDLPARSDFNLGALQPLMGGQQILSQIEDSILRCLDLIQNTLKEIEKMFPFSPLESGAIALLEHQLHEELFYQKFLQPAWNVWQYVFKRHNKDGPMGLFLNEILFHQNLLTTFAPHVVRTLS
jgi:uncharacterized Rossmann fold enzyme